MLNFAGSLYVGMNNDSIGTQLWQTDNGTSWSQVTVNGFGDSNNNSIESGTVFNGSLFLGTNNSANGAEIWMQNEYTLAITSANGTVAKNPDQATYHEGDVVQLTATPNANWTFGNWTDGLTGTANPGFVTIHGNTSVTANYTQDEYTLTINKIGNGTITADKSAPYHYGDIVQLTAIANTGWIFTGWSDACAASPCSIKMDSNKFVTATFTQSEYTLTINKVGNGIVTANKPAPYYYGDIVQLTATPAAGSTFTSWSGACTGIGICSVTMDAAKSVTANFTPVGMCQ